MPAPRSKNLSPQGRKRKRTDRPYPRGKPGRPCAYRPEFHDLLAFDAALCDNSIPEFAKKIGVPERTVYDWLKKFPGFSQAWDRGLRELRELTFRSVKKRIEGLVVTEEKERTNPDGSITRETIKKEIPPDSALLIKMIERLDKKSDESGQSQIQKLMAMLMAADPSLLTTQEED